MKGAIITMSYRKYPIDDHDRLYLHNFLNPYLKKGAIYAISKRISWVDPNYSYLAITTKVDDSLSRFYSDLYPDFNLPAFETEKMFTGLSEEVAYKPEELGIDRLTTAEVDKLLRSQGFERYGDTLYRKWYGSVLILYYSLDNKKVGVSSFSKFYTQIPQTIKQVERFNRDLKWLEELNRHYDGYNNIY